jgi:cytochrome b subunit of formate dehydrogenase
MYAMFREGTLPTEFVKHHHPIWCEKLTGKK